MKRSTRNLIILLGPFLIMILTNELFRAVSNENGYEVFGKTAINSAKASSQKCTWICHNSTNFCKENHVKISQNNFAFTDKIYFGIIHSMQAAGNYALANILFFVILIPLLICLLLIKSLDMQSEIKTIKNKG